MESHRRIGCPVCRRKVSARALFCPRCGTSFRTEDLPATRRLFGLSLGILLAGAAASVALCPLGLTRLSFLALGFGALGAGSVLLGASWLLLFPRKEGKQHRTVVLLALEAARESRAGDGDLR